MTSVGSGSLMIVLLLFVYPTIGANQLVGTDLTQAVPLTLAAALGALVFGHVVLDVTASLIIGSVPAVLVGSMLSSTDPRPLRPSGDRVRDLRLGPQVRGAPDDGARLGAVRACCSPRAPPGSSSRGPGGRGWRRRTPANLSERSEPEELVGDPKP